MTEKAITTIDITPTPRILRMLGEIDLQPKQCFAEFVDNALDEGVDGTPGRESGGDKDGETLRIEIETASMQKYDKNYEDAQIAIRDNGPGMSKEDLERNLKAGYSGKDPFGNMGLFGMGFNIATARLGNRTTVRTTRKGDEKWAVVTINLRELEADNSYELNVNFEEKEDSSNHGTQIIIDQLSEVSRTLQQRWKLPEELGDTYTPVLENENVTILLDGEEIEPRPHCVWSKERSVSIGGEEFPAIIEVDEKVGEAYYCKDCWTWWEDRFLKENLDENETPNCPACGDGGNVIHRDQRVWGWVGIQRFFDEDYYGIDLIRNGRIIEKNDKSLFDWENPETGEMEKEYPIDATHFGGRIVGELHIDFVPVTNVKDGFRKENQRWEKVRKSVRGEASLRPSYAREHGYEPNRSPIGKLYKGYRSAKEAGEKRLVPGKVMEDGEVKTNNAEPQEWAEKFWDGHPEYQDDTKWWKAVQRAETAKRSSGNPFDDGGKDTNGEDETNGEVGTSSGSNVTQDSDNDIDVETGTDSSTDTTNQDTGDGGFDLDPEGPSTNSSGSGKNKQIGNSKGTNNNESQFETEENKQISGNYGLEDIDPPDIEVTVKRVIQGDLDEQPVIVEAATFNERTIVYNPSHDVFAGFGHQPIDAVLMETASTFLGRMDDPGEWTQIRLYAELKAKYCPDERLTPESLATRASDILMDVKERIADEERSLDGYEIEDEVRKAVEKNFFRKMRGSGEEMEELLESSAYLEYAPHRELIRYFRKHSEQFFDGTVWDRSYSSLGSDELKQESVDEFIAYLRDALMLSEDAMTYELGESHPSQRMELERAAVSLRILKAESAAS